jgi:ribonuclease BN (tRNA processing enzyme)
MTREFDFRDHAGAVRLGPVTVEPVPVVHAVPAFGFRVRARGRSLAYSGDTGPCAALDALAEGADLLLAEASFVSDVDNPPDLHLTGADCGRAAAVGNVARLVLTHVPPWYDAAVAVAEAKSQFSGQIDVATTGAVFTV